MNEELQAIVERMVQAGESEESIRMVIENYEPTVKKKEPSQPLPDFGTALQQGSQDAYQQYEGFSPEESTSESDPSRSVSSETDPYDLSGFDLQTGLGQERPYASQTTLDEEYPEIAEQEKAREEARQGLDIEQPIISRFDKANVLPQEEIDQHNRRSAILSALEDFDYETEGDRLRVYEGSDKIKNIEDFAFSGQDPMGLNLAPGRDSFYNYLSEVTGIEDLSMDDVKAAKAHIRDKATKRTESDYIDNVKENILKKAEETGEAPEDILNDEFMDLADEHLTEGYKNVAKAQLALQKVQKQINDKKRQAAEAGESTRTPEISELEMKKREIQGMINEFLPQEEQWFDENFNVVNKEEDSDPEATGLMNSFNDEISQLLNANDKNKLIKRIFELKSAGDFYQDKLTDKQDRTGAFYTDGVFRYSDVDTQKEKALIDAKIRNLAQLVSTHQDPSQLSGSFWGSLADSFLGALPIVGEEAQKLVETDRESVETIYDELQRLGIDRPEDLERLDGTSREKIGSIVGVGAEMAGELALQVMLTRGAGIPQMIARNTAKAGKLLGQGSKAEKAFNKAVGLAYNEAQFGAQGIGFGTATVENLAENVISKGHLGKLLNAEKLGKTGYKIAKIPIKSVAMTVPELAGEYWEGTELDTETVIGIYLSTLMLGGAFNSEIDGATEIESIIDAERGVVRQAKEAGEDPGLIQLVEDHGIEATYEAEGATDAEVDQKAEQYVAELDQTIKSDPEQYWSVSPVKLEDAKEGTVIEVDGGKALVAKDGDIKGLYKIPGSEAKGVADNLLQEAVEQGGTKLDNFDNYLTPIYERNGFRVVGRTPFSEEYAPDGWNKEKHGTPDVVAMVYDPNKELEIEEQVFTDPESGYQQMIDYRDSFIEPEVEIQETGKVEAEVDPTRKSAKETFEALRQEGAPKKFQVSDPEAVRRAIDDTFAEAEQEALGYTREDSPIDMDLDQVTREEFVDQMTEQTLEEDPDIDEKIARDLYNKQYDKAKALHTVENVMKSMESVDPDLEVVWHDNAESYEQAVVDNGGTVEDANTSGFFDGGSEIHMNANNVQSNTLFHEATHKVIQAYAARNPEAVSKFHKQLDKALEGTQEGKDLKAFTDQYDQNMAPEEAVTEFVARVADGRIDLDALPKSTFQKVIDWIKNLIGATGMDPNEVKLDNKEDVIKFAQKLSDAFTSGKEIKVDTEVETTKPLQEQEQGGSGDVGTVKLQKMDPVKAPNVKEDNRPFSRLVDEKSVRDFNGKKFITNMYDFTTAGEVDLGNGNKIELYGGKNYVPLMMHNKGLGIGDVSNLAAFNTKENAEGFIRNSKESGATLFMPHSGTIDGSWQFQHSIFEGLVNVALDNGILTPNEMIATFNSAIKSAGGKKAFNKFKSKLGENIRSFNSFKQNPKELLELLDADNNYSPDLRKALNDKLAANKKFQEAIGVKNKSDFAKRMMDPMNEGVVGGELMGIIDFDNTSFEVVKTKPGDVDHHPSFGYTVLAKINGIYQPTEFHQSVGVTDSYTKYNKDQTVVSQKTDVPLAEFKKSNVSSSAGAIPKVAKVEPKFQKKLKPDTEIAFQKMKRKDRDYDNQVKDAIWDFMDRGSSKADIVGFLQDYAGMNKQEADAYFDTYSKEHRKADQQTQKAKEDILDGIPASRVKKRISNKGYDSVDTDYIYRKARREIADELPRSTMAKVADIHKKIKAAVKKAKQEAKDLKAVKRDVVSAINNEMKGLLEGTKSGFTRGEAKALTRLVRDANTYEDVADAVDMVKGLVDRKNVKFAEKKLDDLVNYKTSKTRSGRRVARTIDPDSAATLDAVNDLVKKNDPEAISKEMAELDQKIDTQEATKEDMQRYVALDTSLKVLNAKNIEADSPAKVSELVNSIADISEIIANGRAKLKAEKKAASEVYAKKVDTARKDTDITGEGRELTDAELTAREKESKSIAQRTLKAVPNLVKGIFDVTSDLPTLLSSLSKGHGEFMGGKMNDMIYKPLMEAATSKKVGLNSQKSIIDSKLKEIFGHSIANPASTRAGLRSRRNANIELSDGTDLAVSQMEMATIYNMSKNDALKEDLSNIGIDSDQMKEVMQKMDPETKQFADWLVDEYYPEYYPRINEVYKDMFRANMPIQKAYAGKIYREGGFDDTSYDLFENKGKFDEQIQAGSTKGRVKSRARLKVTDSLVDMLRYTDEMEHFIAYARPYKDAKKILSDQTVKSNIEKYSGKFTYNLTNQVIDRIATPKKADAGDRMVNWLMSKFIVPKMALNFSILPKQASSFIAFANAIPNGKYAEYTAKVIAKEKGVGAAAGTLYSRASKTWREMYDNSAVLQDRYSRSMKEQMAPYKGEDFSALGARGKDLKGKANEFLMFTVKQGDKRGVMGAMPVYMYHKDQYMKKNKGATEQQAIDYALSKTEPIILETQQSSDAVHKDITQLGSPWARAFNVFLTTPKQYLRKEIRSGRELGRQIGNIFRAADKKRGTKGTFTRNLADFALFHSVLPMSFQWIMNGMPGVLSSWDDDDSEAIFRAGLMGNINGLFMIGDVIMNIKDYAEGQPYAKPSSVPLLEPLENVYINYFKARDAKSKETRDKYMAKTWASLLELVGIPASRILKMQENYKGFMDAYEDKEAGKAILNALMYSQYMIENDGGKKKKKGKGLTITG